MSKKHNLLDDLILEAIQEAYSFNQWEFQNEAEFKHELYHILANKSYKGNLLKEPIGEHKTPIIHSESKPENGKNGPKADILLCDPNSTDYQTFNYKASHIIELKLKFSNSDIKKELTKLNRYERKYETVIFASSLENNKIIIDNSLNHTCTNKVVFKQPDTSIVKNQKVSLSLKPDLKEIYSIIKRCINISLLKYGGNKKQYRSFFWCNFEGEIGRRHSFPCEGDFNAYLYSQLREHLPKGIILRSEYKPINSSFRIDFLITDSSNSFAIPIEVKMNWDQFKEKHSEVERLMTRFKQLDRDVLPFIVVIQGEWRIASKIRKERSMKELKLSKTSYYFYTYNEKTNKCETFLHKSSSFVDEEMIH